MSCSKTVTKGTIWKDSTLQKHTVVQFSQRACSSRQRGVTVIMNLASSLSGFIKY